MPDVLVSRISRLYTPASILEAFEVPRSMEWVETTLPLDRYKSTSRGARYHQRRIRYFVDLLRAGQSLEPIHVAGESPLYQGDTSLVSILDGHHRFLAHYYLRRRRVPAIYEGETSLLNYLLGSGRYDQKLA